MSATVTILASDLLTVIQCARWIPRGTLRRLLSATGPSGIDCRDSLGADQESPPGAPDRIQFPRRDPSPHGQVASPEIFSHLIDSHVRVFHDRKRN